MQLKVYLLTFCKLQSKQVFYRFNLGLSSNTSVSYKMIHPPSSAMQGFAHLDPLTVISLSFTWVIGVVIVVCGLRFISKVYS